MQRSSFLVFVLAPLVVTATLAGSAPQPPSLRHITAGELIPLASSQREFKIIDGKDRGKLVPLTVQADTADEKRWKLSFGDYGRLSLRSSSGALILDRLELFKSKSYVVYEPALSVLPAEIDAVGLVRQTEYKMYSGETGKLKRAGRVTHLIKRISPSQFSTPAGLIDGYQVEIEHKMDMEYHSQLSLTVNLGCRLDEGLVYGSAHYHLKKLGGLLTESKTSAAALSTRTISISQ
jgi:hypothetical protein